MNNHNRCLSCMTLLSGASACPACGSPVGCEPDNPLYLPAGCLLNNRYLIGRVIGVGGFGIVYLAWDNNLDIKVAVKEYLPKEYAARASDHLSLTPYTGSAKDEYGYGMERFLDEAKALAKFQDHVGIVTVYESFKANNTAYMVMQYLDGITLKEFLKRQPGERISFDLAVKALTPIMDALREVHSAGYVHRDISPDNIFITRQKQVKLLDFGAARYAIGEHSKSLTSVLKHGYAPKEQYSTKGNQGPWTDVYAVAATLYRCVTGQVPPDAMERMQEADTIKSPKQLGIDVPLQGELALMKGLALRAVDRFASVEDLQAALIGVVPLDAPVKSGSDVIQPRRPAEVKVVECPECGAKNQLQPGDDPGALRCGKCRRELGVKAAPPKHDGATQPVYAAPVEDSRKNNTMLKYAIIGIVAVCVLVFVIPKKKAEIASPPAPAVGAPKAPEAQRPSPAENQEKLVYKEPETGLVWARNGNIAGRVMNWHEAMSWANNLSYAGYSDWRLPTKDELESLAKVDENRPSEWLNAYGFNNVQAYGYWSSSTYAGSTTFAWVVGMGNGDVYGGYKGNYRYVWPVRGGQ